MTSYVITRASEKNFFLVVSKMFVHLQPISREEISQN